MDGLDRLVLDDRGSGGNLLSNELGAELENWSLFLSTRFIYKRRASLK